MIDLHTHTNYSDGTWSVKRMLEEAEKLKLDMLAITDHDNVLAQIELRDNNYYPDIYSGKIVSGVELNVMANGAKVEILGYDFDVDKVNEWCSKNYNKNISEEERISEFNEMVMACQKHNIILDKINYIPSKGWPIEFVYPEIKKHIENKDKFSEREWNDIDYFFRCFTSDVEFPVYVNLLGIFPDIKDAVKMIHEAGGKVFLAHLYKYPIRDYDKFLKYLIKDKLIDGIEVYHSSFSPKEMDYLFNYCLENKLLMSGGSDTHGDKKKSRKLGVGYDNLNIPKELVKDWLN